ncbi:hypothetical protein [Clostridium sp. CCUG 7971]|uniref:hypothetical protein n=1 Tax=Clostridium sp. CCUG 7971 TaxID=2811414 RepID=UPI001ABB37A8|nr:hypothetical protein [Clostridium sp. CCUG 7971]MBO3445892.1 hypothetical protein [Clostridium sp. CCUG 7971]
MDLKPMIGISYELLFQIFNTILILGIVFFIIYVIFNFFKNLKYKNKYENRIAELEHKINNLENKINKNL